MISTNPPASDSKTENGPFQNPYTKTYKSSVKNQTQPFYDAVSSISCAMPFGQKDIIGLTSWDGSVRICQINDKQGKSRKQQIEECAFLRTDRKPVNKGCFNKAGNKYYFCDMMGEVSCLDLEKMSHTQLIKPSYQSISSIHVEDTSLLLHRYGTGRITQHYLNLNNTLAPQSRTYLSSSEGKDIFREVKHTNGLIVGLTLQNRIEMFKLDGNSQSAFSRLQFMDSYMEEPEHANCIAICEKGVKLAMGKPEGVVGLAHIEYQDTPNQGSIEGVQSKISNEHIWWSNGGSPEQTRGYRKRQLYPINCLDIRPGFEGNKKILAAGVANGNLRLFDMEKKVPLRNLGTTSIPVTNCKFTNNGQILVYALGDDWHTGQKFNPNWAPIIEAVRVNI